MSLKIELTRGKYTLVDDKDYDYLNKWKWWVVPNSAKLYAARHIYRSGKRTIEYMHRVILNLSYKDNTTTHHKNGDSLDNRRDNLMIVSIGDNVRYREKTNKKCLSKYKGVTYIPAGRGGRAKPKWQASIRKNTHLGYFDSEKEAARAYDKRAKEIFGEFAKLNFTEKLATS